MILIDLDTEQVTVLPLGLPAARVSAALAALAAAAGVSPSASPTVLSAALGHAGKRSLYGSDGGPFRLLALQHTRWPSATQPLEGWTDEHGRALKLEELRAQLSSVLQFGIQLASETVRLRLDHETLEVRGASRTLTGHLLGASLYWYGNAERNFSLLADLCWAAERNPQARRTLLRRMQAADEYECGTAQNLGAAKAHAFQAHYTVIPLTKEALPCFVLVDQHTFYKEASTPAVPVGLALQAVQAPSRKIPVSELLDGALYLHPQGVWANDRDTPLLWYSLLRDPPDAEGPCPQCGAGSALVNPQRPCHCCGQEASPDARSDLSKPVPADASG